MAFKTETKINWNGKEVKILGKKAMNKSVFDVGLIIEGQAKALAPVDLGQLRGSITTQTQSDGSKPQSPADQSDVIQKPNVEMQAFVGTAVEHGIWQEFGTKYMNAQPFLRPALDLSQGKSLTIVEQDCKFMFKEYLK